MFVDEEGFLLGVRTHHWLCIQLNSSEFTAASSVWLGRIWYRNDKGTENSDPPPCFYNLLTFLLHVWYKMSTMYTFYAKNELPLYFAVLLQQLLHFLYMFWKGKLNSSCLVYFFTWQLSWVTQSEWFLSSNNRSRQHPFLEVRFYPSKLEDRCLIPLGDLFRWRGINSVLQMDLTMT